MNDDWTDPHTWVGLTVSLVLLATTFYAVFARHSI